MTRTKAWRLSLTFILMFGWLFLTPAYSDDPLDLAAQEIAELAQKSKNLNYKDDMLELINIAANKHNYAKEAKENMEEASDEYNDAVDARDLALSEKNLLQSQVDGQTVTVDISLNNKNNAQDELNAASINLQTANINLQAAQSQVNNAGGAGLQYTVYNLVRTWPSVATPDSVICSGTWNSNSMQLPVCGNRYENIVVKFTGVITVPSHWTSTYFAGYTDDGFRMFVNGSLAVNNWTEQGVRWSPFSPVYDVSEDKTLNVEIWWYNGGGPGSYHLGWAIPGGWTGAGCDYTGGWGVGFSCNLNTFSSGSQPTQQQLDNLSQAQQEQIQAQQTYNNKLEIRNDKVFIYNQEVQSLQSLQSSLTLAEENLITAEQNLITATQNKINTTNIYNQSLIDMNEAIDDAWEYYDKQLKREIAIALAQALANQPKPEPTQEPTIEPSPKPTYPDDISPCDKKASATECVPKPEPTPEVTPGPEPTPEPTTEPTEDPKPEPTKEPEPEPTVDSTPKPEPTVNPEPDFEENTSVKDKELNELIPEKGTGTTEDLSGVIANLTSKDNKLVKLSPEQIAAVSQTLKSLTQEAKSEIAGNLGISASEVEKIAESMKDNQEIAKAFVEFESRAESAGDASMPYTLADATTEVQTEAFLSDPIGAFTNIDFDKVLNPSEWGKDMTDDQREKAQEVIVPVIIAGNIVAAAMTRRI